MTSFNLDISPLPTEFIGLVRAKFTGYIAIHKKEYGLNKSYYLWLARGNFVGAYPQNFDLLDKLVELDVISSGKAQTIKAIKKQRNESIHQLLNRLDLQLETPTTELLSIIFEEQCNLGKEIFATRSGKATIFPIESESELPQDNLTGQSLDGLKFFIRAMRDGSELMVQPYKSLIPYSIYSLRRLPYNQETPVIIEALDIDEKSILQFADGVMTIKEIAKKCHLQTKQVKLIFIRLHLLGLVDTDISPNLQDKVMARAGYQRVTKDLDIQINNNKALTGAGVIGLTILVLNLLGLLQPMELSFFDRFTRWRNLEPSDDITLVTFDDEDIRSIGQWPLSDRYLATVLKNISQHDPVAIGLDLIRDIPNAPGTEELEQFYRDSDKLVAIKKFVTPITEAPAIPAQKGAIASSDLIADPDTIIRRHLIALWDGEKHYNSLGTELASRYLDREGAKGEILDNGTIQLGEVTVKPLSWWNSGYRWVDYGGAQMLANYSGMTDDFTNLSLTDVYQNKIDPKAIEGKVILIGSIADSLKDYFNTPLSKLNWGYQPTPGVVIHANTASALIRGIKGEIQLLRPLNLASEIGALVLAFVIGIGGGLVILWYQFSEFSLPSWIVAIGISGGLIIAIIGGGFYLFTSGVWIPVFSLSLASMTGLFYASVQFQQFSKKLLHTDRITGAKNRKYLMQVLNLKHERGSNYSLVGVYSNLSELNLDRETQKNTVREIYRALNKFVIADCEIVQLSINCFLIVLDIVSPEKIAEVEMQIDKTLTGLNITDDSTQLQFKIASANNVSLRVSEKRCGKGESS